MSTHAFSDRTPLVIDLEATCWGEDQPEMRARQQEESEMIEIGAVLLDPATLSPVRELQTFIRPVRHPVLSEFCTGLTSITQAQVDAAPLLPQALSALTEWIGEERVLLCAWGNYERSMFRRSCAEAGVRNPFEDAYLNIKEEFTLWARCQGRGKVRVGMSGALKLLGMPLVGTHHRGIDDARMIAAIFKTLRDPARMSPPARRLLDLLKERDKPLHRGHLKGREGEDWGTKEPISVWWPRVTQELERLGLARDLGAGRGIELQK